MFDVFISYARDEYDRAVVIKDYLEGAGLRVYLDVDGIDGGDVFPDVLDKAVKTAGAIVGVWSPYALTRPWVRTECLIGKDRGVLIPVLIEPVAPMDVPAAFYGLQVVDLSGDLHDPESRSYKTLMRSLARTLKRPDLVPSAPARERVRPQAPEPRVSNASFAGGAATASGPFEAHPMLVDTWRTRSYLAAPLVVLSGLAWNYWSDIKITADALLLAPLLVLWVASATEDASHRSIVLTIASLLLGVGWYISDDWQFGGTFGLAVALAMLALNLRVAVRPATGWALPAAGAVIIALSNWAQLKVSPADEVYVNLFAHDWLIVGLALLAVSGLAPLRMAGLAFGAFALGALPRLLGLHVPGIDAEMIALNFNTSAPGLLSLTGVPIVAVLVAVALGAYRANSASTKTTIGLGWLWVAVSVIDAAVPDGLFAAISGSAWAQAAAAPAELSPEVVVVTGTVKTWTLSTWIMIPALGVTTGAAFPHRTLLAAAAGVAILFISTAIAFGLGGNRFSIFEFLAVPLAVWLGASRARLPQLAT